MCQSEPVTSFVHERDPERECLVSGRRRQCNSRHRLVIDDDGVLLRGLGMVRWKSCVSQNVRRRSTDDDIQRRLGLLHECVFYLTSVLQQMTVSEPRIVVDVPKFLKLKAEAGVRWEVVTQHVKLPTH